MKPDIVVGTQSASILAGGKNARNLPFPVVVGIDSHNKQPLVGPFLHALDIPFLAAAHAVHENDHGHRLGAFLVIQVGRHGLIGIPPGEKYFLAVDWGVLGRLLALLRKSRAWPGSGAKHRGHDPQYQRPSHDRLRIGWRVFHWLSPHVYGTSFTVLREHESAQPR